MATRGLTSGFKTTGDVDLGNVYISRDYLIDVYPNLIPSSKAPGLFIWGRGNEGQLGLTDATSRSSPVQVGSYTNSWKQVAAGNNFTIAVKTDGTLWSWGVDTLGQLGQNNSGGVNPFRSSPIQVGTDTNWKQAACGKQHAFAVKTDGTLWGWGENTYGQIGQNTEGINFRYSSPVQVGVGTDWRFVACGWDHTLAIKTDGTLWAWGMGMPLGINNPFSLSQSSPVQVGTDTNWEKVAAGASHSMGIKSDGTLWAWGSGTSGQLGLNNLHIFSTPQAVGGSWKDVACGFKTTIAIKSAGSLWAWGEQSSLYLYLAGSFDKSSPVQIGFLSNYKQVAAGWAHYFILRTDGTLAYWGLGQDGQLGQNDRSSLSVYGNPPSLDTSTTWKHVACGYNHTVAIKDAGF